MIKLIIGSKGSGKTKLLIDKVNNAVKSTTGDIVCIEQGMKLALELDHKVRLIDAVEYSISGYDTFYGFVQGVLACNYDIKELFVDGILKIGGADSKDYDGLGELLAKLYKQIPSDVTILFTVSADQVDLPDSVLKFS
ncbi:MAG: ATP-binding protein [Oscillospiraceae bacterium]